MPRRSVSIVYAVVGLLLMSCVGGVHESYFRVTGNISNVQPTDASCELRLHRGSEGMVDYTHVSASFKTGFVVPPRAASYQLIVACSNGTFESVRYELGRSRDFNRLIDLGSIHVEGSSRAE